MSSPPFPSVPTPQEHLRHSYISPQQGLRHESDHKRLSFKEWVFNASAGSGTPGAVARKMGRRWLLIQNGRQCHSPMLPHLRQVSDGTEQTGVSKAVHWQGGGGFRYPCLNARPAMEHSSACQHT